MANKWVNITDKERNYLLSVLGEESAYTKLCKNDTFPGIYQIRNILNNKKYIGSSKNVYGRTRDHRSALRGHYHVNKHLQSSWDKYGEKCFAFELIEKCEIHELLEKEQYYVDLFKVCRRKYGYNMSLYAASPMKGRKHSKETLEELSKIFSGENHPLFGTKRLDMFDDLNPAKTDEARKKITASLIGNKYNLGNKHSEETKLKISLANKNRVFTEEHRRHISENHVGMLGKHWTIKTVKTRLIRKLVREARAKLIKEVDYANNEC